MVSGKSWVTGLEIPLIRKIRRILVQTKGLVLFEVSPTPVITSFPSPQPSKYAFMQGEGAG